MQKMRPGISWPDMHRLAETVLLQTLKERGLLQGDVDDMMTHFLASKLQPHGLGHLLGLDTHDVGGYPEGKQRSEEPGLCKLRCGRLLEEGMVLTVEPGCYFIGALLRPALDDPELSHFFVRDRIERCLANGGWGVRLEDDVVVTANGIENLTLVPRKVQDVEAVMAGTRWEPADL